MKGLKKSVIFLILLFVFFPTITKAATRLTASNQNPVVGTTIYVQLNVDYGIEALIEEAHYEISYNGNYFKLEDVIFSQSKATWSTSETINDYGLTLKTVNIDKTNSTNAWEYGGQVQLKFTVLNSGTCDNGACSFKIRKTDEAYYMGGNMISQTMSGVTVIPVAASTNTTLNSLQISGQIITPTFNQGTFNYKCYVDSNVNEIDVLAIPGDTKQTITGAGKRLLTYGDNKIEVNVQAENGAIATYTIMVNRKDNRTGDVALKKLTVSNTNISYKEDEDIYYATVSKSIDKVLINATASDSNAMLTGTGTKNLEIGNNTFNLEVISNGGNRKIYTINIIRADYEIQQAEESNELLSLSINGLVFDMNDTKKQYLYGVTKDTKKLEINAVPKSKTAKIEITGNEKLKTGFNTISLKVVEQNETFTEYKIIVYKSPTTATQINSLENLNVPDSNLVINISENAEHILSKEQVELIKNYEKKLYYNVVNIYNGINYQIKVDKNIDTKELDLSLERSSSAPLTYKTKMPSDLEVTLYIGDMYNDKTLLKIYTFDGNGSYTLLTDGVIVTNGYVTFTTTGAENYIFTPNVLGISQNKANNTPLLIGGIAVLIVAILLINIKNKKNKEKIDENEPLY